MRKYLSILNFFAILEISMGLLFMFAQEQLLTRAITPIVNIHLLGIAFLVGGVISIFSKNFITYVMLTSIPLCFLGLVYINIFKETGLVTPGLISFVLSGFGSAIFAGDRLGKHQNGTIIQLD